MAFSKIILNGTTLLDVTDTTATIPDVLTGKNFHTADGVLNTGTASGSSAPVLQTKSVTPTESAQAITPDSGYDGLSEVDVGAISTTYVGTGIARQAGSTITPTKSQQTAISSGKFTTGDILVNPIPVEYITTTDATATAADILSGETAYVNGSKVTGNLVIQHYYTGSSTPSSSLGVNGDIYLKTS